MQTRQLEDWSMLREEEMTGVENLPMQFSLPDTEAAQILRQWSEHWSEQIYGVAAGTAESAAVHKGGLCKMLIVAAEDKMQPFLEVDPRG